MTKIISKKLKLENYGCHEDFKITFKDGLNIISGNHGNGKSTLMHSICYAIWGEELRHTHISVSEIFKRPDGIGKVTYDFEREEDGISGRIIRGKTKSKNILKLIWGDNEFESTQAKDKIAEIFPVSFDMFKYFGFLSTEMMSSFKELKPAEVKRIFLQFIDTSQIEDILSKVVDKFNTVKINTGDLQREITKYQNYKEQIESEIKDENKKLKSLNFRLESIDTGSVDKLKGKKTKLLKELDELGVEYVSFKEEQIKCQGEINKQRELLTTLKLDSVAYKELLNNIQGLKDKDRDFKHSIELLESKKIPFREKIELIESGKCDNCGSEFTAKGGAKLIKKHEVSIAKIDIEVNKILDAQTHNLMELSNLEEKKKKFDVKIERKAVIDKDIADQSNILGDILSDISSVEEDINNVNKAIGEVDNILQREKLKNPVDSIKQEINLVEKRVEELQIKGKKMSNLLIGCGKKLENLENLTDNCKFFMKILPIIKSYMLDSFISEINNFVNKKLSLISNGRLTAIMAASRELSNKKTTKEEIFTKITNLDSIDEMEFGISDQKCSSAEYAAFSLCRFLFFNNLLDLQMDLCFYDEVLDKFRPEWSDAIFKILRELDFNKQYVVSHHILEGDYDNRLIIGD